jgi:hypothetical protein
MNPFGPTVVAAATAVALYVYLQWKRSINKAIPGIPFLPPSFPFGNLSLFAKLGPVGAFDEALKLGPVAGMWFFAREWLLIRHHEDVKTVFVSSVFRDANPVEQLHNEAFPGRKVSPWFSLGVARFGDISLRHRRLCTSWMMNGRSTVPR